MASRPDEPSAVAGRIDRSGRLLAAEPALAQLQREAGSDVGRTLALPQILAIARLALRLGTAVERPATVASSDQDIDLWVRATPEGDEIALELQRWSARPASGPRLQALHLASEDKIAETGADMGWTVDPELKVTEISAELAHLLEVDAGEAVGLPLTRLLQLAEDKSGEMPLISALAARRGFSGQPARTRTDDPKDLILEGEIHAGPDGAFHGFRGRAVTRTGSPSVPKGEPSSRFLDPALDDILRSPLDRIIADAERITGRTDGPLRSDYASYGNDIAAAARHLLSVIEAMGDDPEYGHGHIDLGALAAEAVMLAEPAAEDRKVTISLDRAGPMPSSGEERAVIQILVNLITNAVRHSPEGGEVCVSFAAGEDRASVTVADQGSGIAKADQQRIFERFERADEAPGGTGLGLAIARRLARSMGGDVMVDSAPGEGARFTLTLPSN